MSKKEQGPVNVEKLTFEQAIEQLTGIVERVEAGEVGLEESIQQYEVGCKLIQHCRQILARAEQRIEVVSKNLQGELQTRPAGAELQGDGEERSTNEIDS